MNDKKLAINPLDLTNEECLFDILKQSHFIFNSSFNLCMFLVTVVVVSGYMSVAQTDTLGAAKMLGSIISRGYEYCLAILGFLIAGFTIFAALGDKKIFLLMAAVPYDDKISYLKYTFFSVMSVFIFYIIFIVFAFFFFALVENSSFYSLDRLDNIPGSLEGIVNLFVRIVVVVVASYVVFLMLLLKTFIFNIYAVVMAQIRGEIETRKNGLIIHIVNESKSSD